MRPIDIAMAGNGDVLLLDTTSDADNPPLLERITPSGTLSVFAGADRALGNPTAVAVSGGGTVYVSNYGAPLGGPGSGILKVDDNGGVSTIKALDSFAAAPMGLAIGPDGSFVVATDLNVLSIANNGTVHTIAGTGQFGGPAVGPALESPIRPGRIGVSSDGDIYVPFPDYGTVGRLSSRVIDVPNNPTVALPATVLGSIRVGNTVTLNRPTFNDLPDDATVKVSWRVAGRGVGTSDTLRLKRSWLRKVLRVVVTATWPDHVDGLPSGQLRSASVAKTIMAKPRSAADRPAARVFGWAAPDSPSSVSPTLFVAPVPVDDA